MSHSNPQDNSTCLCCWDEISADNYVEYQISSESSWLPSGFCQTCIEYLIKSQWKSFTTKLSSTTCQAEARRLLERGPPINLRDPKALPAPDDAEIYNLWYMSDQLEHSPKLEGSLVGEEREKYWEEMKSFYVTEDSSEGADSENSPIPDAK